MLSASSAPTLRAAAIALVLAAALGATPARAQTQEELTRARQTFIAGKELEKKNQWAEALEKFKEVAAVKMTPQVRFHVALCEENLGKLVSAMKGFELAAEEARLAGSSAAEVAENAPTRAEALRKRVAKLEIKPSGRLASSKIVLDGIALPSSAIGSSMPVDPGKHVIEVRDEAGKSTFKKEIEIAEKGSESVVVEVDDPDPDKVNAPPPPPPPPPPPSRAPVYVAGGIGVASGVAAGVLFGLRAGTITDVTASCKDAVKLTGCSPKLKETADQGRLYGTMSGVFLGVGIAGVVGAGILYFVTNPKKPAPSTQPKASLMIGPQGGTIGVESAF